MKLCHASMFLAGIQWARSEAAWMPAKNMLA